MKKIRNKMVLKSETASDLRPRFKKWVDYMRNVPKRKIKSLKRSSMERCKLFRVFALEKESLALLPQSCYQKA